MFFPVDAYTTENEAFADIPLPKEKEPGFSRTESIETRSNTGYRGTRSAHSTGLMAFDRVTYPAVAVLPRA